MLLGQTAFSPYLLARSKTVVVQSPAGHIQQKLGHLLLTCMYAIAVSELFEA